MDYRNILSLGFVLLAGSVFVHSLKAANAFPSGPNVSLGSNPIEHGYGNCNNSSVLFTNNSVNDLIITDITIKYTGYEHTLYIDGVTAWSSTGNFNFISGLKINPASVVTCSGSYTMTISGYYTH